MVRLVSLAVLVIALACATPARAVFHLSEISEAMSGITGDPTIQFVEIRMLSIGQTFVAHTRLTHFNCDGTSATVLIDDLPGDVANQGVDVRWLMASSSSGAFLAAFGVTPDFTFAGGIDPTCGNVCWGAPGGTPPNPPTWDPSVVTNYTTCLAYGGYSGPQRVGGQSVVTGPLGDGLHSYAKTTTFSLVCPTPENNAHVVGALPACTPPPVDQPVDGKKLTLKDDPLNAFKKKVVGVSKDPDITVAGDPRVTGASIHIVSATGDMFDTTYALPPNSLRTFWKIIGAEGANLGYTYKDGDLTNGPVKSLVLKAHKLLKFTGKGAALGHTLVNDPTPVDVVVTIGGVRYCQEFGGTIVFKTPKSFTAKVAAAPGACPP